MDLFMAIKLIAWSTGNCHVKHLVIAFFSSGRVILVELTFMCLGSFVSFLNFSASRQPCPGPTKIFLVFVMFGCLVFEGGICSVYLNLIVVPRWELQLHLWWDPASHQDSWWWGDWDLRVSLASWAGMEGFLQCLVWRISCQLQVGPHCGSLYGQQRSRGDSGEEGEGGTAEYI